MTDADLVTIDQRIQRAGAANCWTGTLGSLAGDARRLVRHIQETRKMACEYPVDHILRGERELRKTTGDETVPEEAMILTEDDAADVAEETARAAQIGDGRVFPEPETAFSEGLQPSFNDPATGTAGKWVDVGQAAGLPPGWNQYQFVPQPPGPPVAVRLLEQATAAVRDRHAVYGPPTAHFARTVGMVNSLFADVLKRPLTTSDWARIMLLDKLARDLGPRPHPDNAVDLAGYAACLAECNASAPPADGGE